MRTIHIIDVKDKEEDDEFVKELLKWQKQMRKLKQMLRRNGF